MNFFTEETVAAAVNKNAASCSALVGLLADLIAETSAAPCLKLLKKFPIPLASIVLPWKFLIFVLLHMVQLLLSNLVSFPVELLKNITALEFNLCHLG